MESRPDAPMLVIASNRLPVTVAIEEDEVSFERSAGGLVSALAGLADPHVWVGWPGRAVPDDLQERTTAELAASGYLPVFLTADEENAFYSRICNETIWPLFHYFSERVHFSEEAWRRYVEVNERFADAIAATSAEGARVWIHDFHLLLVPEALRRRRPDLAIGFFLHIPFPSSEIYRLLPPRAEVLRGVLGADYIGFHTGDYARHFRSSCLRVLGVESDPDAIQHDGRLIGVGVHPVGIDVASFRETLGSPETAQVEAELAEHYRGRQIVLGIERLDYSKGIPQKIEAFERFLEQDPVRAETTTMVQVLVPSRLLSPDYQAQRDEIEMKISHVNGLFGQPGRTPIEYIHRSVSASELVALYRRADVMMVTPLRDGMNLVAQEFVLCQGSEPDERGAWRGVLLLSELAGAAQVLPGALLVNPWDRSDLVARLAEALALDPAERRRRLELMVDRVEKLDCTRWAAGYLRRLDRYAAGPQAPSMRPLDESARAAIRRRFADEVPRTLLLDYDGTLRELMGHPDLAAPTAEILDLLGALAALPDTAVHVVSGRKQETMDEWFGQLPIHLCAEHGYLVRGTEGPWEAVAGVDISWLPLVERLFERVAADVPGTLVERKHASVAWHYRQAEPEYGTWRARELLVALDEILGGIPAEVLPGHRVIEVRARGVNKGAYVQSLFPPPYAGPGLMLAAGDDVTDADLYRALPPGSVALHIGPSQAREHDVTLIDQYLLRSPSELRAMLRSLVEEVEGGAAGLG